MNYPEYIQKMHNDDVGIFFRQMGKYLVYDFKIGGRLAVTEAGLDQFYTISNSQTYQSITSEDVMAKAKKTEESAKTEEKQTKPSKTEVNRVLNEIKPELREKLNALEDKQLNKVAKTVGVDVKKYESLPNAGLRKMSTVNSIIGSISKQMRKGEIDENGARGIVA